MKGIEDFYLEEIILFQIQKNIIKFGELDKLLQAEKDMTAAEAKRQKKKCEKAKSKKTAEFDLLIAVYAGLSCVLQFTQI